MNKEISPKYKDNFLPEEMDKGWLNGLVITEELLAEHPTLQDYLLGQFNRWENIEQRCEIGSDEYRYAVHMMEALQQKMTEVLTFGKDQTPTISIIFIP